MLLVRGLLGYGALSCYFWSVQHLPLGDAVLLQYSHPIFVAALAPRILREPTGPLHWPLVLAAFLGLATVVGVGGSFERAAAIGLAGACLSGLAYMTVRQISRTEGSVTVMFWFALVMLPASILGSLIPWSPLDSAAAALGMPEWKLAPPDAGVPHAVPGFGSEWWALGGIVVAGLVGQIALTEGLARAGAARAVAVTMAGPLFGLLFDRLFFGQLPSTRAVIGTAVVLAALALLARLEPKAPLTEGEEE
jgi:drug/metabolite transporter (DMT)-like permease